MIWFDHCEDRTVGRVEIIRAPFRRLSHAIGMLAFVVGITLAPTVFNNLAPAAPEQIYRGVPAIYGNFYTIGEELAKPRKKSRVHPTGKSLFSEDMVVLRFCEPSRISSRFFAVKGSTSMPPVFWVRSLKEAESWVAISHSSEGSTVSKAIDARGSSLESPE